MPCPSTGGYYYDAYANQMVASNKQYQCKQLWMDDPNFSLYPSYHYNTPFGQLGNSYVDPTYMDYRVNGNGRQRDDGPSGSSIAKSVTMQEVEVVENGTSGKLNDEISLDIVKSVAIQEAEVVENGAYGKPNDETSQVMVHADGVVEAASHCRGSRQWNRNDEERSIKVMVNGNGVVNDHGSEDFISV